MGRTVTQASESIRRFFSKELSLFDTGVEAEFGDRFLTLSTCSYQVEDGRFVVVAKEVEPGDQFLQIRD
ncbi:hypothetical protein [Candidatus Acetatifactor stercoripullorum]|uniref:hypothetical protein n=1 Tax=Candidatus Acetatifactor stercoripullorum TaxID=2838414 RepID=UPI00298D6541|nr:hypothetical protein [Candidatus Acetatifactor stercoripullorum]